MARKWIKLWVERCLHGTMISELTPVQRWVWIGLLLLAGQSQKPGIIYSRLDENRNCIGYSVEYLAEVLSVSKDDMIQAIQRLLKTEKIKLNESNVIEIVNWSKYQSDYSDRGYIYFILTKEKIKIDFSKNPWARYREIKQADKTAKLAGTILAEPEELAKWSDALRPYHIRDGWYNNCQPVLDAIKTVCHIDKEDKVTKKQSPDTELDRLFDEFWSCYPQEGRLGRKESYQKFKAIYNSGKIKDLIKATNGYIDYLKHKRVKEKFEQRPMYAKTFLNARWQEFIDFKYEPPL